MYTCINGKSLPLGAAPSRKGVNFAVFSEHAESIELCLYDEFGQIEIQRIKLNQSECYTWCIFVEGLSIGAKYGYRAYGKYEPKKGFRFNPEKLLVDPYARELDRTFTWSNHVYGFDRKHGKLAQGLSDSDSGPLVPKSVVTARKSAEEIEAIQQRKPNIPWADTVVYEAHVRGFTQLNLSIPSEQRGTFLGLAHSSTTSYLKSLGVTALELLPVHSFIDEAFLVDQGLSNFWGYNTLNFFSPHLGYLSTGDPSEFYDMVESLHKEGIEVILDVVYNHTAESNEHGPTLSFRGLDNLNYYRLEAENDELYINDTGCGNTVKSEHPRVLQLILDSLRYWAGEMGVDGFRFDLASILGRNASGFHSDAAFFQAVSQDPILSHCKLIAEPWDIGPGGYQLGAYPGEWSEWNDKYRDICRRFWRGEPGLLPEFARRIHGSSDLFEHNGRGPRASLNLITSHDGFTLADTVSYNERHNEANNENNADGHHSNYSENYGIEGDTDREDILIIRQRQQRNFIATLFLSQGTPMLLAGDELGRSQSGNNNAYCQDNEINWLDWTGLLEKGDFLLEFTKKVIQLRKTWPSLFSGKYIHQPKEKISPYRSAIWLSSSGGEMTDHEWHHGEQSTIGWLLKDINRNQRLRLLLLFNASEHMVPFRLPENEDSDVNEDWCVQLDTVSDIGNAQYPSVKSGTTLNLASRSMMVLTLN